MSAFSNQDFSRLVILQSEEQVNHYRNRNRRGDDTVLPIGAAAMYQTRLAGWHCCSLGDLWSRAQYEEQSTRVQKRLDHLIAVLNNHSRKLNPDLGLEIGYYYAFQLFIIIGQILHNSFIVRGIQFTVNTKKILCYTKAEPEPFLEIRPDPDCLLADVLARSVPAKEGLCEFVRISESAKALGRRQKILSLVPMPLRRLLRAFRRGSGPKKSSGADLSLLIFGAPGDWLRLSRTESFSNKFNVSQFSKFEIAGDSDGYKELLAILNDTIREDGLLPYDLSGLARRMQSDLAGFTKHAGEIDSILSAYDAAVTAVLSLPIDNFLAHRAINAKLPVVVWQHGERGQCAFDVIGLYTELFYASDYLAYAQAVVDFYSPWIGKYHFKKAAAVGGIEKHIEWRGGGTILYATGKWFKTTLPMDPDSRLFEAHMKILDYLDAHAGKNRVVFKANNTPRLNDIPYSYKNIEVEYDSTFTECLKSAKVVILDTPATTLVEACSTKVPIFVLDGRAEYRQEFLDAVCKRVVWCKSPDELVTKLDVFLRSGDYPANVDDVTYISQYGCGDPAAKVAKSVQDALLDSILRERSNGKLREYVVSGF